VIRSESLRSSNGSIPHFKTSHFGCLQRQSLASSAGDHPPMFTQSDVRNGDEFTVSLCAIHHEPLHHTMTNESGGRNER